MNSTTAFSLLNSIDQTIVDIDSLAGSNPLADSYYAKFLVVYICGIYEETVETILVEFIARNTSRVEIATYFGKNLARYFRNPDFTKLEKLVETFGNTLWLREIKNISISSERALNSIVGNKNALAHGQLATITLSEVKQYYHDSRQIIEKIDELFN